jgi:hypothetical protein
MLAVPRSVIGPGAVQRNPWYPKAIDEVPATWPLLLMAAAELCPPPDSAPRSVGDQRQQQLSGVRVALLDG